MASLLSRTSGFFEWVLRGEQTYKPNTKNPDQGYTLPDAVLNHADTDAVRKNGQWNPARPVKPEPAPGRLRVIKGIKWVDVVLRLFTGALFFGLLQALTERARVVARDRKVKGLPLVQGALITLGLIARVGSFFANILTAIVRMPFLLISGAVGVMWGLVAADKSSWANFRLDMRRAVTDFIWPFAPMCHKILTLHDVKLQPQDEIAKNSLLVTPSQKALCKKQNNEIARQTAIYVISAIVALTIVLLLATGTLGIGVASLPLLNTMISGIAGGLNTVLGWAGLHIAHGGAALAAGSDINFAALPILNGIAGFLGFGNILTAIFIGTSLFAGVTSIISQTLQCVVSNTIEYDVAPGSATSSPTMPDTRGLHHRRPDRGAEHPTPLRASPACDTYGNPAGVSATNHIVLHGHGRPRSDSTSSTDPALISRTPC